MKSMKFQLLLLTLGALVACSPDTAPESSTTAKRETEAAASIGSVVESISIEAWGPQATAPGVPVNPLPSGDSGLYFVLAKPVSARAVQVFFEGRPLEGAATDGKVITAALPTRDIIAPGKYRIILQVGTDQFVEAGDFVVAEPATTAGTVQEEVAPPVPGG